MTREQGREERREQGTQMPPRALHLRDLRDLWSRPKPSIMIWALWPNLGPRTVEGREWTGPGGVEGKNEGMQDAHVLFSSAQLCVPTVLFVCRSQRRLLPPRERGAVSGLKSPGQSKKALWSPYKNHRGPYKSHRGPYGPVSGPRS